MLSNHVNFHDNIYQHKILQGGMHAIKRSIGI
jgi:hypothetical protein